MKIQTKHLLPLSILLPEMGCNILRTQEVTGAGVTNACGHLPQPSTLPALHLLPVMLLFVVESRKAFQCKVPVASGSTYLVFKKNALIELSSLSKTYWFTAQTLEVKLLGFYSYLPLSVAGRGIKCLLFSHHSHDGCSRLCNLLPMRFFFFKNADFQTTAARFPELLPVLII